MFVDGEFGPDFVVLDGGRLLVRKGRAELFEKEGLTSLEAFMQTEAGEVLAHRRGRTRRKITFESPSGPVVFYLKQYEKTGFLKRLAERLGRRTSAARWELHNILNIEQAGLATVRAAAVGEAGPTDGSFILLEELSGYMPMHEFLEDFLADADEPNALRAKRQLIKAAAGLVRRLHTSGIVHRDLYICHIFVHPERPTESLRLIDLQRIRKHGRMRLYGLIKDLAALNYSADHQAISRTDRMRFVCEYFGTTDLGHPRRWLLRLVAFKTRRIRRHDKKIQSRQEKEQQQ